MVHYGKHIIEPETGLCEICDRGAIHDFKKGKRPGRQFLYSNQDGRFTYRPSDENEVRYNYDEATPRYVRKPLYPEPPPPRPRPVVHKKPIMQKQTPRREYSPDDENQQGPQPRLTTFYYVDNTGQMYPKNELPPDETPRPYVIQDYHRSPPTNRPIRNIPRRAQTPPPPPPPTNRPTRNIPRRVQTPPPPPPPPASEPLRSKPRRQYNSNEENLQHPYRSQTQDVYYQSPTRKAELYHIDGNHHETRSNVSANFQEPYDHRSPRVTNVQRRDTFPKQRQLNPVEQNYYIEPEPTVVKKVYKKLPSTRDEYPSEPPPNENRGRVVRKIETFHPPPPQKPQQQPRTYESSPQLANGYDRNPIPNQTTVYYVEGTNRY